MSKRITLNGVTKSIAAWCRDRGANYTTVIARLNRGWDIERALTTPLQIQNKPNGGYKVCTQCLERKHHSEFTRLSRRSGNEYAPACRVCDRRRTRGSRAELRRELLRAYGPGGEVKCSLCPESREAVLDLDHINGGGRKDREQYANPQAFYQALRKQGFPPGLRVLCRNCNWIEHLRLQGKGEFYGK